MKGGGIERFRICFGSDRICVFFYCAFKNGFIEAENKERSLLRCLHPNFKVHREILSILSSFNYLNDIDKLVYSQSNCDIIIFSAKTF